MGAFQPFDSIGRLEIQSIGPSENRGEAEGAFEDCVWMKGTEIDVEVEESVDRTPR